MPNTLFRGRAVRGLAVTLAAAAIACGGDSIAGTEHAPAIDASVLSAATTAPGARVRTLAIANIRSGPYLNTTLLGTQPLGAAGTVVGGPVTDVNGDKLTRWQINFDTGVDGWAADAYLDQTAPAPAPAKFTVGARVQALGIANVRNAPKGSATLLGTQPDASPGFVIGGPVMDTTGDRLVRWQVNFDTGVDGWAAQDYLAASTIVAPVAAVVVTPDSATLISGRTLQLAAVARDAAGANLQNASFTWSSTDTLKARVTAAGLVTAAAAGTVFIIAKSGSVADTAVITAAPVPVASVTVTPSAPALLAGDSVQLSAVAKDSAGNVLPGRTITWRSSDTTIARVSSTGMARALAAGVASVTASSGASGTASLNVSAPVAPAQASHPGWFVSPSGSSTGDGSQARPWNFATAASGASGRILPGDTVWMRGGTYRGPFRVMVSGAAGSPVVFRQYPNERAIIDGAGTSSSVSVFYVGGQYTMFWGFEITNSDPVRTTTSLANNVRPNVVSNYASHTKYVDLIVHDGGVAFYNEPVYGDVEISGCLIYNNGWQSTDRGHGHGLYLKSNNGPVVARDNVVFNQFGYGIHAYSNAGSGNLVNLHFEGNVAFNNGTLSTIGTSSNILLGGDAPASADVLLNNFTYFASTSAGTNVKIGYGTLLNGDVQVQNNYFVGGSPVVDVGFWTTFIMTSNVLSGTGSMLNLRNTSTVGQTLNGNTTTAPTATQVVVRPVAYETGRANVIVYNWGHQGAVLADVSGVLQPGDHYVVRNVQDLFGTPVLTGTYGGGSLTLPMSGVTPPAPVGMATSIAPKTGPFFDVFIVTRN